MTEFQILNDVDQLIHQKSGFKMSVSSARRVASNATLWLGRVASTAGRRLGGSGGSGRPASTLDDTNATPDPSSVDSSNESQTTSTAITPFFRPPAGFAICTDSGVAVPREVMLPMLNDFDCTLHMDDVARA